MRLKPPYVEDDVVVDDEVLFNLWDCGGQVIYALDMYTESYDKLH